jgi:hypothetical protein
MKGVQPSARFFARATFDEEDVPGYDFRLRRCFGGRCRERRDRLPIGLYSGSIKPQRVVPRLHEFPTTPVEVCRQAYSHHDDTSADSWWTNHAVHAA